MLKPFRELGKVERLMIGALVKIRAALARSTLHGCAPDGTKMVGLTRGNHAQS